MIDHLFRHQFGKMVAILTRIFGFEHLQTIEDAVQDTFVQALKAWRTKMPENPEAWLTASAKNRVIDIFRKINKDQARELQFESGPASFRISEMFLESEIEDSQLRMIFKACHPALDPKEQIAFSLRAISGFSTSEIASALLVKEETIKKRLQRAKKNIIAKDLSFEIPMGKELITRMDRVLEVIYVIFNEGFHSNKKAILIRKDLCGEAMRLCKMLLKKESLRSPKVYALFALMCFHSARLESRVNANNEIIDIRNQDRSLWHFPLLALGSDAMNKAVENNATLTSYHYEAAIAAEHLRASTFEETNWKVILEWYTQLNELQSSPNTQLSIAIVHLQLNELAEAKQILDALDAKDFAKRVYLYYSTISEYYQLMDDKAMALTYLDQALAIVNNESEKTYLEAKRLKLL